MPLKNKTWFAILGLLSWKPMSGYDIKKLVEMGLSHFWSASYGQLFPTLNRLVEKGLVVRHSNRGHKKRKRHVYAITPEGRRQFESWLRDPSDPPRVRNEFELKFFLSSRQSVKTSIRLLEEYRDQQRKLHEHYLESEQELMAAVHDRRLPRELEEILPDEPSPPVNGQSESNQNLIFLLTLRHGIRAVGARLAWCEEALLELGKIQGHERRRRD
jgi:DNA-binding PadR family transcriptional regulator